MAEETRFEEEGGQFQDIEEAEYAARMPYPFPLPLPRASGLYEWKAQKIVFPRPTRPSEPIVPNVELTPHPSSSATAAAGPETEASELSPWWFQKEELRLDVDGRYAQMMASGTVSRFLGTRIDWIAKLTHRGANHWTGSIWYKDGSVASFPYTDVDIQVTRSWFANQRKAVVIFSGGGASSRVLTFKYKSPYFHRVEFEFDRAEDAAPVASVNTCDHPNHPSTIPCEPLSIESVFRRAGFDVRKSGGDGVVPHALTGSNGTWSDMEMHDAMQAYWSRFANLPQWSMWTFFAARHDMGSSLGGIMFDDIGSNHRQGTAIFTDSFIANAPAGDPNPAAWVQRMRFWTAVHEMGHAFNLAHSWQKALGTGWIPLSDEPEARSFMNYPYRVAGGQSGFFADFEYRFSDAELLFMRHAPERFVQMGNAEWFDHHGFRQADQSAEPTYRLEVRANRERPIFDFMEPVVLELKLTNVSSQAQLIPDNILTSGDNLTVIVKKDGKTARQFVPYALRCTQVANRALDTGASIYESLFISVGRNGWDIAEPGYYNIQVALHLEKEDIVSAPLRLRVAPSRGYDDEFIAQDFFSDDVGRILTFDGSRFLNKGNDTLREVVGRLPDRRVATHARIALGNALARNYKLLQLPEQPTEVLNSAKDTGGAFQEAFGNVDEARHELMTALCNQSHDAAETLGHVDYKYYTDRLSEWLAQHGDFDQAGNAQNILYDTLSARSVIKPVLDQIASHREAYRERRMAAS